MGDIIVWADGTYCDREMLFNGEMSHKSNDYRVIAEGTAEWADFCINEGLI